MRGERERRERERGERGREKGEREREERERGERGRREREGLFHFPSLPPPNIILCLKLCLAELVERTLSFVIITCERPVFVLASGLDVY